MVFFFLPKTSIVPSEEEIIKGSLTDDWLRELHLQYVDTEAFKFKLLPFCFLSASLRE